MNPESSYPLPRIPTDRDRRNRAEISLDPTVELMRKPEEVPLRVLIRTFKLLVASEDPTVFNALRYAFEQASEETVNETRKYRTRR